MGEDKYNILCCDHTVKQTEGYLRAIVKEQYSQDQVQQILEALNMAQHAHEDQLRCNNDPYIIHPMRVALMLLKFDSNTISKVFIAALLHDTVEKTSITPSEIESHFGWYVAKLVRSVSRKHYEDQSPQEKTEAKYQNWVKVISSSHDVRMIKICEDLDNMICWKSIPESDSGWGRIPRWMSEAETMSLRLAHITNAEVYSVMCQEYDYYVKHGFVHHSATT
jgi:GTP diphosphokinase / guanosine-3',5'-bis(diphosphate) 3'-diphosphatase